MLAPPAFWPDDGAFAADVLKFACTSLISTNGLVGALVPDWEVLDAAQGLAHGLD